MQTINIILQLISAICEIVGVILMAHSLLVTNMSAVVPLLCNALFRGASARGVEFVPQQSERRTISLQGLAFIALGFFIQAFNAILSLILN